jgi:hypothetical protein
LSGQAVVRDPNNVTHSTRRIVVRNDFKGTTLRIRLLYARGDQINSLVAPLTIRVFGAGGTAEFWTALRNLNGDLSVPIQINPAADTYAVTAAGTTNPDYNVNLPDNNAHSWDCDGCDRFLVAVEKVYSPASGGGPNDAYLQAKIV